MNYPLSRPQHRLWLAHQLAADPSVYNSGAAFRVQKALIPSVLDAAILRVLDRHRILRTVIDAEDGVAFQRVLPLPETILHTVDHPGTSELEESLRVIVVQPFDLSRGPVCRAVLLRLPSDESVFVFAVHHIACDGGSFGIFIREFATIYSALARNQEPVLAPLPLHYTDWASKNTLDQTPASHVVDAAYWQEVLKDYSGTLDLTTSSASRAPLAPVRFTLDAASTQDLSFVARTGRATPFMALLAILAAVIYRLTGESDVLVFLPLSGRENETEAMVGIFGCVVPIRCRISEHMTFRELLSTVRSACRGSYAHQNLSMDTVLHCLPHSAGASPFQVMMSYQENAVETLCLDGVVAEEIPIDCVPSEFPFSFSVDARDSSMNCCCRFNERAQEKFQPEAFLDRILSILSTAMQDPDINIGSLPLLSEPERAAIVEVSTGPEARFPWESVSSRFAQVVEEQPQAHAIKFRDICWTYRRLDDEKRRLAAKLLRAGIEREQLVGICLARTPSVMAAMLAILSVGAVYVPLDPQSPASRNMHIVKLSGIKFILVDNQSAAAFSDDRFVLLNTDETSEILPQPCEGQTVARTGQNLAYVLFTSGSTGGPKGVMVSQESLLNLVQSMVIKTEFAASDTMAALTTLSFDIAQLEFWMPLLTGGTVWLADSGLSADGRRLSEDLRSSGATFVQGTPSTLVALLEFGWRPAAKTKILSGGEQLSRELAGRLLSSGAELYNLYGPTETTIWSTLAVVTNACRDAALPAVTVGKPLHNTSCYVVDQAAEILPSGILGELYIGGDGVALGYLGNPALTADRFVPDPFALTAGARRFRTGDLVRRDRDGNLEFFGRSDTQIKLRGFRIELGEIEEALEMHDTVRQAVVVLKGQAQPEPVLAAYFVPRSITPASYELEKELRSFLRMRLPDHMVPAQWIALDAFPLTANRKVDRRALENLAHSPLAATTEPAEMTSTEARMKEVWESCLGLDLVGLDDNLLDLGGNSLSAIRIAARAEDRLGIQVTPRDVFEYPTIRSFARRLSGKGDRLPMPLGVEIAPLHSVDRDRLLDNIDLLSDDEVSMYLESLEYLQ